MQKSIITIYMIANIMLFSACGADTTVADGYQNASIQQAYQTWSQQDKSSFIFLDVRTLREYNDGHIPGATHIPVQTLAEHLNDLPKGKNIYIYCESGVRASKAAKLLATSGFEHVYNFKASMRGWRNASYPIEK